MKEFFVGLSVLAMLLVLAIVGAVLMPFVVVLGVLLQGIIYFGLVLFSVWLVGWVTLWAIERRKK